MCGVDKRRADLGDSNRLDDLENRRAAHDEQEEGQQPRSNAHLLIGAFLKREKRDEKLVETPPVQANATENCAAPAARSQNILSGTFFTLDSADYTLLVVFVNESHFLRTQTASTVIAALSLRFLIRKPTSSRVYYETDFSDFLTLDLGTFPLRVMFLLAFSLATLILCVGAIARGISWLLHVR